MFTKTIIKEVKVIDESKIKELESRIKELESIIKELEQEKVQIRKDSESEKRIKENEIHIYVQKAVEDKNNENNILKSENATLKKEVEILEKAFENMGFVVLILFLIFLSHKDILFVW